MLWPKKINTKKMLTKKIHASFLLVCPELTFFVTPRNNIIFIRVISLAYCVKLEHGRLCSLANTLYWIVETFPCKLARLPNYLPAIYAHHTLQSWTKSVEILQFRTADLVPVWPLPSPHPGQICLFGIRNDPAGLQHFFFFLGGGEGRLSICSCQRFQALSWNQT